MTLFDVMDYESFFEELSNITSLDDFLSTCLNVRWKKAHFYMKLAKIFNIFILPNTFPEGEAASIIERDDVENLKKLQIDINTIIKLNSPKFPKATLLQYSILCESKRCENYLIEAGASEKGVKPYQAAVNGGNPVDIAIFYHRPLPEDFDCSISDVFVKAVKANNMKVALMYLQCRPIDSLLTAVDSCHLEMVRLVLEVDGFSECFYSCKHSNTQIASLLLQYSPYSFQELVRMKEYSKVRWFLNTQIIGNGLPISIKARDVKMTSLLLDHYVEIDERDEDGNTPIHLATMKNDIPLMEQLINKSCNVNIRNNAGKTPLFYAVERSSKEAVDLLLHGGAIRNMIDTPRDIDILLGNESSRLVVNNGPSRCCYII